MKKRTRSSRNSGSTSPLDLFGSSRKPSSTMRRKTALQPIAPGGMRRLVQPAIRVRQQRRLLATFVLTGLVAALGIGWWLTPPEATRVTDYLGQSEVEYTATSPFDIFSQPFEQPSILRALHQGDVSLSGVQALVPASAPAQYQGIGPSSDGQKTTKKIYAFRLAIELESMMQQEWPKKMFTDVPVVLREIVHSDVGSMARVRMESDPDALVAEMSKGVTDWAQLATKLASFIGADMAEANRQARATAEFAQAVGGHAQKDAGLLRDALYSGAVDDFRRIYDGLSRYVLGSPAVK